MYFCIDIYLCKDHVEGLAVDHVLNGNTVNDTGEAKCCKAGTCKAKDNVCQLIQGEVVDGLERERSQGENIVYGSFTQEVAESCILREIVVEAYEVTNSHVAEESI